MKRVFTPVFALIALAGQASAGPTVSLTISGPASPLSWDGTGTSPTFNVAVANPVGDVTDMVVGWSLGLSIVRDTGTGTLSFDTATIPSNYVFASDSSPLMFTVPAPAPTQLLVNGVASDNGVVVPESGTNLLALTFSATAGTSGKFEVMAFGDPNTGSYWTPVAGGTFPSTAFGNVPFGQTLVRWARSTLPRCHRFPSPTHSCSWASEKSACSPIDASADAGLREPCESKRKRASNGRRREPAGGNPAI